MTDQETIESCEVPGFPNCYVIGSFDNRITFYSQQVRALNLIDALLRTARLDGFTQVAVIGGGAAGMTAAAALALTLAAEVELFERERNPVFLQRACTRRSLHPHLFDWPAAGSLEGEAGLPILDWRAGIAANAVQMVEQAFRDIVNACPNLHLRDRCRVVGIERRGDTYEVQFERCRPDGNVDVVPRRYNAVFLAVGFGLEKETYRPDVISESYWSDAGLPQAELTTRPLTRYLITGNGDGGLIDLVATVLADFDHRALIDRVVHYPGIQEIHDDLLEIDREARRAGERFDFVGIYDTRLLGKMRQLGLIDDIRQRLRDRIRVTFHTREPELLKPQSATLNRLLTYIVIRADRGTGARITHVHGDIEFLGNHYRPGDPDADARHFFECGGSPFGVDRVIIRHGPDRDAAFDGFSAIRDAYHSHHDLWLSRDPERRAPPTLSLLARDRFDRAASVRHVPVPRHRYDDVQAELAAAQPATLHIVQGINPGTIRLIANVQIEDLASFWSQARGRRLALNSLVAPAELGPFSHALARLAIHAANVELSGNAPDWIPFLTRLTEESAHASSLICPFVGAMQPATDGPLQELPLSSAADVLHHALDEWTFHNLDDRVRDFLARGTDPYRWIGCLIHPALRSDMDTGWTDWRQRLALDAALRRRFLILTVSADDPSDGDISEALTLVGPMRMRAIFRCAVLALAIATGWRGLTLKPDFPGNLSHERRSGHACGADLIEGRSLLLKVDAHPWSTDFVLLAEATAPIEVGRGSETSLLEAGGGAPSLRRATARTSLIIPADVALLRTLEFGGDAMETHLRGIQEAQRAEWAAQLDLKGDGL